MIFMNACKLVISNYKSLYYACTIQTYGYPLLYKAISGNTCPLNVIVYSYSVQCIHSVDLPFIIATLAKLLSSIQCVPNDCHIQAHNILAPFISRWWPCNLVTIDMHKLCVPVPLLFHRVREQGCGPHVFPCLWIIYWEPWKNLQFIWAVKW